MKDYIIVDRRELEEILVLVRRLDTVNGGIVSKHAAIAKLERALETQKLEVVR